MTLLSISEIFCSASLILFSASLILFSALLPIDRAPSSWNELLSASGLVLVPPLSVWGCLPADFAPEAAAFSWLGMGAGGRGERKHAHDVSTERGASGTKTMAVCLADSKALGRDALEVCEL